jgi:hypothetical protein
MHGDLSRNTRRLVTCLQLAALVGLGCGSSSSGNEQQHPVLPQVPNAGGAMLVAPDVVSVAFAGDPMAADLEAFGATLTTSSWWSAVTGGDCQANGSACIGAGSGAFVQLSTEPADHYTDSSEGGPSSLQTWLQAAIAGGQIPAPAPGAVSSTVYVIYLPQTSSVSVDGDGSCVAGGFGGYHSWLTVGAGQVAYAVVIECAVTPPPLPTVAPTTVLQQTTLGASHEVLEAATDPVPATGYALDGTNTSNWGWIDVTGGGELADMCLDLFGLNQDHTSDGADTTQRIWSNARAAAGMNPCVPVPAGELYFNAAPRQQFFVLPVGGSATFEVDAFAFQPMSDWMLTAQDWSDSTSSYLSFSIAGAMNTPAGPTVSVHAGSTVQVTVTLTKDPGDLPTGEADGAIVSISGSADSPTGAHLWPIGVMSPADAVREGVDPTTMRLAIGSPPHLPIGGW